MHMGDAAQPMNEKNDEPIILMPKLRHRRRRLSTTDQQHANDDLFCQVEWVDKMLPADSSTTYDGEEFRCQQILNGTPSLSRLKLDLPAELADEQKKLIVANKDQSVFYLKIPGGWVNMDDFRAVVPDPSNLTVVTPTEAGVDFLPPQRKRHLAEAGQHQTAIVVRVQDVNGRAPPDDRNELYRKIFQAQTSLKFQYEKCSGGTTIINPQGVGVVDVRISTPINYENQVDRGVAEAERQALAVLNLNGVRSLEEYAGLVLYVVPDSGNWLAYATIGGSSSVYNGAWGGRIHGLMHEVRHSPE